MVRRKITPGENTPERGTANAKPLGCFRFVHFFFAQNVPDDLSGHFLQGSLRNFIRQRRGIEPFFIGKRGINGVAGNRAAVAGGGKLLKDTIELRAVAGPGILGQRLHGVRVKADDLPGKAVVEVPNQQAGQYGKFIFSFAQRGNPESEAIACQQRTPNERFLRRGRTGF